jgi:uncharacterized protein
MSLLTQKSWSPYAVGAAIGVLSWFAFATVNKPLGITTAFEYTAALAQRAALPSFAATNSYYAEKTREQKPPKIDWEWMLVVGVFFGAFVSSNLSGDRPRGDEENIPALWKERFGDSRTKRFIAAFCGGAVMMFGARMAQGCTSGHGISGALQLAVSSWLFVGVLFVSGCAVSFLLYGQKGGRHV